MVETATKLGQEYIKKYYNSDFVLRNYDIIHSSISSTMYLYGYIKGHEDEMISVSYNYEKKEVVDIIGPKWFINSRTPPIDSTTSP